MSRKPQGTHKNYMPLEFDSLTHGISAYSLPVLTSLGLGRLLALFSNRANVFMNTNFGKMRIKISSDH